MNKCRNHWQCDRKFNTCMATFWPPYHPYNMPHVNRAALRVTVLRDENMVNRIDCVIFYDGLSSLFKAAVRSLTCDLTCSFPYSLPSRLSTSLSCSLSSSLPASLSSSLLCGFPANLLFSLLERHRHMCISHNKLCIILYNQNFNPPLRTNYLLSRSTFLEGNR